MFSTQRAALAALVCLALAPAGCAVDQASSDLTGEPTCDGACYRLRVPARLPADGVTSAPVFVDVASPALASVPIELHVRSGGLAVRPAYRYVFDAVDAAKSGAAPDVFTTAPADGARAVGDWWVPEHHETARVVPCDAAADEGCLGTVELVVTPVGAPDEVLASATIELLPPSDELGAAACEGVGNVGVWTGLAAAGVTYGIPVERSAVAGPWRATFHHQSYQDAPDREEVSVAAGEQSVELARVALGVGASPAFLSGSPHEDTGVVEATDGSCKGMGTLVVHELELGEPIESVEGGSSPDHRWVERVTASWSGGCLLGKKGKLVEVPVRGCVHYDAWNP